MLALQGGKPVRVSQPRKYPWFSGFDASFTNIVSSLDEANISHTTLHGSQSRIDKILRDFKDGIYRILFLIFNFFGW